MSYNIKITAEGGELAVTSDGPKNVPDGVYTINGHEEPGGYASIQVAHTIGYQTVTNAAGGALRATPAPDQATGGE